MRHAIEKLQIAAAVLILLIPFAHAGAEKLLKLRVTVDEKTERFDTLTYGAGVLTVNGKTYHYTAIDRCTISGTDVLLDYRGIFTSGFEQ